MFSREINCGSTINKVIDKLSSEKYIRLIPVLKSLIGFFILSEYEGISLDKAEEILNLKGYSNNKNSYLTLFTLDEDLGPFTREELRVLNSKLQVESLEVVDRLVLALCLEFGLRPIQIALIKESDFVEDLQLGICYLNIPRVKNNTKYRRLEFTKRIVSLELANLIKKVIENNKDKYGYLAVDSPPLIYKKINRNSTGVRCDNLLKKSRNFPRIERERFFRDINKPDLAFHVAPQTITKRLNAFSAHLPLSPRTGKKFHLNAYRFRYTIGTNAVIEGMTEEEVADLLDHRSTLCVKHYFRYTREMWEMLENATIKRTEQKHFTAAWCREEDLEGNIYGSEVIETHAFTAIGKCYKKTACYLEPAVACYTCDRFCPNKDKVAHSNALVYLKERQSIVAASSPTSLPKQLSEVIAGCEAAIAYSDGIDVVNIHQGEDNE
ncbi:phage integrase family protein [Vibrio parahaemolyticus V14/01]|nr:phage integrase family protein [Vibrio parahaemolyticus V14/01]